MLLTRWSSSIKNPRYRLKSKKATIGRTTAVNPNNQKLQRGTTPTRGNTNRNRYIWAETVTTKMVGGKFPGDEVVVGLIVISQPKPTEKVPQKTTITRWN